jgi:hypothetical protein
MAGEGWSIAAQAGVVGWKPLPRAGPSLGGYAHAILPRPGPRETHPQTVNEAWKSLGREKAGFFLAS